MADRRISKVEVTKKTGISYRSINAYAHGEQIPGADAVAALCEFLGISADELLGLEGQYVAVPIYGASVSGGHGRVVETEEKTREIHFRRDWLHSKTKNKVGAFPVVGDSMAPDLRDGELVLVDFADTEIQDGQVYVYRKHGAIAVKRLHHEADRTIRAYGKDERAEQKLYDTFSPADQRSGAVEIVGRVFWRGGKI